MGPVYLPTWIVDFYDIHVGRYTIHWSCGIAEINAPTSTNQSSMCYLFTKIMEPIKHLYEYTNKNTQNYCNWYVPLDPKTMKHAGFRLQNMGYNPEKLRLWVPMVGIIWPQKTLHVLGTSDLMPPPQPPTSKLPSVASARKVLDVLRLKRWPQRRSNRWNTKEQLSSSHWEGWKQMLPSLKLAMWVFPKIVVPQIIHFKRVFHYKPSILGFPYFWKHSYNCP